MGISEFKVLNVNASRIGKRDRVTELLSIIKTLDPTVICIQEINTRTSLQVFKDHYQVVVNQDDLNFSGIGIATLINKKVYIEGNIISKCGRIIGTKIKGVQIWNVYPLSGSENKNKREIFFREELLNLMMNWKDESRYVFQVGDHNCTHRDEDSLNNKSQHKQNGLISEMNIMGLKDAFIQYNGNKKIEYSRTTRNSGTRIDLILSNVKSCSKFEYLEANMGFDHKMAMAEFGIGLDICKEKENIPKEKLSKSWVIPAILLKNKNLTNIIEEKINCIGEEVQDEIYLGYNINYSHFWRRIKAVITRTSRNWYKREEEEKLRKLKALEVKYFMLMYSEENQRDASKIKDVKEEMSKIYMETSSRKVDKMRKLEIEDHVYDIHKLQREKKYENQSRIKEVKINGNIYEGTLEVIKAIEEEMKTEMTSRDIIHRDEPPTEEEILFLDAIPDYQWTSQEIEELNKPTTLEEIRNILDTEVDLDSSPGEDGITYRCLRRFITNNYFAQIYLGYLNDSRLKSTEETHDRTT